MEQSRIAMHGTGACAIRARCLGDLLAVLAVVAASCTNKLTIVDAELDEHDSIVEPDSSLSTSSAIDGVAAGAPSESSAPAKTPEDTRVRATEAEPNLPETTPSNSAPARDDAESAGAAPPLESVMWPADCERQLVFRAHGRPTSSDSSKITISAGAQLVARFYFKPEWPAGDMQLLKLHAEIDNAKIVHHWGLSMVAAGEQADGSIRISEDQFLEPVTNTQGLASGARGGSDLELPRGVGLQMPAGQNVVFELEVHYFNASAMAEDDGTSVEICITSHKRPIEAAFHMTGSNALSLPAHRKTDVTAQCVPRGQREPIHLLAAIPHMHLTGVRSTLVLNRASGQQNTLLDEPYAFAEQRAHPLRDASGADVVLNPGDTLTTICHYANDTDRPIEYGPRTENEMCEVPILAWPAGALHNVAGEWLNVLTLADKEAAHRYCMDP